ncbi:hypothetical protein LXA43DRAFT_1108008 [Ganoderma leucocontextum]|nr:hypothetical protein LXA43DRAFT_1108008 [Ganoderma leucocontextum]
MMENSTARLALAHRTEVAKQRNATTFLWLYNKLIACDAILSVSETTSFTVLDALCQTEVRGELEAEALLLPHNQGLCVVTGTQGAGGRDPNGTTQVRWIYPPSMNDVSPTHSPELSSYENWEEEGKLEVPHNLIMMREDIYDLFQKHAFGIDLDASRHGEIYVFHSSEIVKKKILHSSLAVEVLDKMARAFIREHFQQCLMSGILGEDVEDQAEFSKNDIYLKLEKLPVGALPKATEWLQDEWWNTETGEALKEWLYYKEDKED